MAVGLGGVALLMATKPVLVLPGLIAVVGLGIGACWGFGVQRLMGGARPGEGALAASAVATVQQTGLALGAAAAGIVATLAGLSRGLSTQGIESAAFWVPVSFVPVALIAAVAGVRLALLAGRSDGKKQAQTVTKEKVTAALPKLRELARQVVARGEVPGLSIGIVYRDEVVFVEGYG
eukprot:gene11509-14646_t